MPGTLQERERPTVVATIAAYRRSRSALRQLFSPGPWWPRCTQKAVSAAKALLHASSRLASFGCSLGLVLDADVLFEDAVIERFVICSTSASRASSRATLRSNLRYLARRVPSVVPRGAGGLPRSHAKAPYSPAQIDAYLALARAQPTLRGHGPDRAHLSRGRGRARRKGPPLCPWHRRRRSIGRPCRHHLWQRRPRVVPVLPAYHGLLQASAAFAGEGYVTGAKWPPATT